MDACSNPECRKLREELERLKSTGYDILKQRGTWQSHGATHDDLTKDFMTFFDVDIYELADNDDSGGSVDNALEVLSKAFQEMFNNCRKVILREMLIALQGVVHFDKSVTSSTVNNEALYDATRAYSLLVHATGLNSSSKLEEVSRESSMCLQTLADTMPHLTPVEVNNFAKKAANLSWNLLTTTPPLVSAQPRCMNRKWHDPYSDNWDPKYCSTNYELVYYRPVLFKSSAGKVAKMGFVGNRKHQCIQDQPQPKSRYLPTKPPHVHVPSVSPWPYDASCRGKGYQSTVREELATRTKMHCTQQLTSNTDDQERHPSLKGTTNTSKQEVHVRQHSQEANYACAATTVVPNRSHSSAKVEGRGKSTPMFERNSHTVRNKYYDRLRMHKTDSSLP